MCDITAENLHALQFGTTGLQAQSMLSFQTNELQPRLMITAGHRTFSEALHEFMASCLSDRTTCPLIHTALPHLV